MTTASLSDISFGSFVLQRNERRLLSNNKPLLLGARAFDVLTVLLDNAGQLVTKQRLFEQVWSGTVVEENNLQVHVSTLRRLLGADSIATVAGRGYRLTAPVASPADTAAAKPPANATINPPDGMAAQTASQDEAQVRRNQLAHRRTVAVLPFVNLGGDADQEYFSDGLAEDIITHLTHSPWLLVVSRNSSFTYRNSSLPSEQVGQALGARYLVLGSVRKVASQLRMTAELVDTHNHETLWSERYDRPLIDLFALQAQISAHVVSTIEPVYLRREERHASQVVEKDMQHWDMLMRALALLAVHQKPCAAGAGPVAAGAGVEAVRFAHAVAHGVHPSGPGVGQLGSRPARRHCRGHPAVAGRHPQRRPRRLCPLYAGRGAVVHRPD